MILILTQIILAYMLFGLASYEDYLLSLEEKELI